MCVRSQIFVGSRTHSQIAQLCRELERTSYRPVISVLASREHYCIHPRVSANPHKNYEWLRSALLSLSSSAHLYGTDDDMCYLCRAFDLRSKRLNAKPTQTNCIYKRNKKVLVGESSLQPGGSNQVWDIEDLVMLGNDLKGWYWPHCPRCPLYLTVAAACPYFAARSIGKKADLVFCPYNHLIDPSFVALLRSKLRGPSLRECIWQTFEEHTA